MEVFTMYNILTSTENMSNEEWHSYRNKGIGGSDVSVICGINKYKSIVELWMEKTNQIEVKQAGEAAYWGNIMEPLIRTEFTNRTNIDVSIVKAILQHPIHNFMLANLDGIINDSIVGECIFEAKTASVYKQDDWMDDKIPEEYMLQIQHYMAVTGYNRTFITVLIGGNKFEYKLIERDDELIEMIIKLEEDFWNHVLNNTPPPLDGSEASTKLLNQLYPNSKETLKKSLPDEAIDLIMQYSDSKEKESQSSEKKDEAANKLKALLGDFECGVINDKTITWKSVTSEKFDTKKFQIDNPELYKNYLLKSSCRRFSIK
jgi:putative phage-type endonuclease